MRGDPAFQKLCEDKLDKRIAVLPFENLSDPHDEYFSDGLSEELISALAQISELKVIGRSSSFRFKDRKEEPKTIGEKLGVSTLLEGTVRKQGNRVRIVAALTNAADGIELWTRTFDRELKDIFAVQEEIAKAVAESLKVRLLGSDGRSTQKAAPSVDAQCVTPGQIFIFSGRHLERLSQSSRLRSCNRRSSFDPNYALAYAERSEAWRHYVRPLTRATQPKRMTKPPSDADKAVSDRAWIWPKRACGPRLGGDVSVDWNFPRRPKKNSAESCNPLANDRCREKRTLPVTYGSGAIDRGRAKHARQARWNSIPLRNSCDGTIWLEFFVGTGP